MDQPLRGVRGGRIVHHREGGAERLAPLGGKSDPSVEEELSAGVTAPFLKSDHAGPHPVAAVAGPKGTVRFTKYQHGRAIGGIGVRIGPDGEIAEDHLIAGVKNRGRTIIQGHGPFNHCEPVEVDFRRRIRAPRAIIIRLVGSNHRGWLGAFSAIEIEEHGRGSSRYCEGHEKLLIGRGEVGLGGGV